MDIFKKNKGLIIRALWLIGCVWILFSLYYQNTNLENKEAIIGFVISMKAITFPSGHIVWAFFSLISTLLPTAIPSQNIDISIRWVAFVAAGYFQWFVLLPKVLRHFRKKALKDD